MEDQDKGVQGSLLYMVTVHIYWLSGSLACDSIHRRQRPQGAAFALERVKQLLTHIFVQPS